MHQTEQKEIQEYLITIKIYFEILENKPLLKSNYRQLLKQKITKTKLRKIIINYKKYYYLYII